MLSKHLIDIVNCIGEAVFSVPILNEWRAEDVDRKMKCTMQIIIYINIIYKKYVKSYIFYINIKILNKKIFCNTDDLFTTQKFKKVALLSYTL